MQRSISKHKKDSPFSYFLFFAGKLINLTVDLVYLFSAAWSASGLVSGCKAHESNISYLAFTTRRFAASASERLFLEYADTIESNSLKLDGSYDKV